MLTYGVLCSLAERHGVTITENMRAFVRAVEEEDQRAQADEPPLGGRWHFGNGVVVCGTLRIFGEDFDTDPSEEFKEQLLKWICDTLNAAQEAYRAAQSVQRAGVARPRRDQEAAYHSIDRFLRNNLCDEDYAEYSAELDSLLAAAPTQQQEGGK